MRRQVGKTAMQRAKCSVFIATSLDGFIARTDGSIDWLNKANLLMPPGEDCGYAQFMSTVDALVMGRNTYDQVRTFDPWLYGLTPIVVLTSHPLDLLQPPQVSGTVSAVSASSEPPEAVVERLTAEGKRHLYVDGGRTVQSFLDAGLVDELIITTIPVLLGSGRPLFANAGSSGGGDVELTHVATRAFDFGFVQSKYRVKRDGDEDEDDEGKRQEQA